MDFKKQKKTIDLELEMRVATEKMAELMKQKEDNIIDVGHQDNILRSYPNIKKYNAKGKAILPGLVNLHTHTD